MAIKFTRSDDLDKMFEEFATLPKILLDFGIRIAFVLSISTQ